MLEFVYRIEILRCPDEKTSGLSLEKDGFWRGRRALHDRLFESAKDMLRTKGIQPEHRPAYRPHRSDSERPHGDAPRVSIPLPRYLRMAQLVPGLVPVSPATIWRWSKDGRFPAPIKLAERVTVWKLEEVLAWLDDRQAGSA